MERPKLRSAAFGATAASRPVIPEQGAVTTGTDITASYAGINAARSEATP
jgi:hypothetical protein